jgi:hypothetical protein
VHKQLSSSAIVFIPYSSALMLFYEFGFGQRGLRLMHLSRVNMLKRMELQRAHAINMTDFSAGAKLPEAPRPTTWTEVQEAVNNLVTLCHEYADTVTCRVALTVSSFISAM